MYEERLTRLREQAGAAELHGLVVVPGPNLFYLTGLRFHLSERPVVAFVPVSGMPVLLVPSLELGKAEAAPFDAVTVTYDDVEGPGKAFARACSEIGADQAWWGVEGRRIRFLELDLMARTESGPRVFDASEVFASLRMRKEESELEAMRRAVAVAEEAFLATLPFIAAGRTEREVAAELVVQLLRAGSDTTLPFSPIVASGPNGANPHAFPTERPMEPGDVVTIDWGANHAGYLSDITRNLAVAGAPAHAELVKAHAVVLAANEAGRYRAAPGCTGQDVDRATRSVVDDAGLGEYFVHRTGHGLGLEGHEEPDMKEGATMPLAPGMTFTVEPGVYIPGLGGIRIEDDVAITATGHETLTSLPRELTTVG